MKRAYRPLATDGESETSEQGALAWGIERLDADLCPLETQATGQSMGEQLGQRPAVSVGMPGSKLSGAVAGGVADMQSRGQCLIIHHSTPEQAFTMNTCSV